MAPDPDKPIPESLVEKARKQEIKGIMQKLDGGKKLTAAERRKLYDWTDEQKHGSRLNGEDLAARWGITRQAVNKYVKAGMPMTSFAEADQWRNDNLEKSGKGLTNKSINAAKLLLLEQEAEKRKIQLARMRAEQISFAQAKHLWSETLIRIANYVRYVDGLSREQAQTITAQIRDEATRIVDDLATCVFEDDAEGGTGDDIDETEDEGGDEE